MCTLHDIERRRAGKEIQIEYLSHTTMQTINTRKNSSKAMFHMETAQDGSGPTIRPNWPFVHMGSVITCIGYNHARNGAI